jgi:RNA polymerase sigma factor (sigma-70 family)
MNRVRVRRDCFERPTRVANSMMQEPQPSQDDDAHAALLGRYAAGDPVAARLLSAALTPRIYGHSLRVLGDRVEAEDVVQEAMVRLWRIAPDWRTGEAKVTTWLYGVVANLCTDRLRKRVMVPLEDIDAPRDDAISAFDVLQQRSRNDALGAALSSLPDRQRQSVVLRHIDGLANPEIAAILDVGIEAVESLTARGKRALTKALQGQRSALGFEDEQR